MDKVNRMTRLIGDILHAIQSKGTDIKKAEAAARLVKNLIEDAFDKGCEVSEDYGYDKAQVKMLKHLWLQDKGVVEYKKR
jgi:hypothetical protein